MAVREQQEAEDEQAERRVPAVRRERWGQIPADQRTGVGHEGVVRILLGEVVEARAQAEREEQPADGVLRALRRKESADGAEREGNRDHICGICEIGVTDDEPGADEGEGDRAEGPRARGSAAAFRGQGLDFTHGPASPRSQSDTCAGCTVSATTPRSSASSATKSTWSRRRAEKDSRVRAAS